MVIGKEVFTAGFFVSDEWSVVRSVSMTRILGFKFPLTLYPSPGGEGYKVRGVVRNIIPQIKENRQ
jgi:hypothetical protein